MNAQTIPVIDLGCWKDPKKRASFVRNLGQALEEIGFFALTNHQIDPELIQSAYQEAQSFFALEDLTKRRYEKPALKGQRGYTSFGKERAKGQEAPDLKEFWHVGQELPPQHPLLPIYGQNVWPEERPQFRSIMLSLFRQLEDTARILLEACAMYLGESGEQFRDYMFEGDSIFCFLEGIAIISRL